MDLHEILGQSVVIFSDKDSDMLISWDGRIGFEVFAGKFNGDYDNIDGFYREVKSLEAAKEVARMWFREHATFNPGP